ncbi:MAG: hypothetical protein MUF54_04335, partial [Polyangiaceae bacterium]|nr:hypothetical protein [Polyangiaceae bacterium]
AWFRCLRSGVPVFAFEFPCCLLLVVGRLSGSLSLLAIRTYLVDQRPASEPASLYSPAAWAAAFAAPPPSLDPPRARKRFTGLVFAGIGSMSLLLSP